MRELCLEEGAHQYATVRELSELGSGQNKGKEEGYGEKEK